MSRKPPRASRATAHAGAPSAAPAPAPVPGAAGRWLDLATIALAAFLLVKLWGQTASARFASDECFHAYLAEWIAAHAAFPRTLPEFYSGLPYFYPPLFHVLGAVAMKLAGVASLKYLNVILTGLMVAAIELIPVPGLTRSARRCAVLMVLACHALALYAVRLYAETLATLLAVLVVLLLLRTRALPKLANAVLLGVAVGASLLAKQPAGVLPVLLAGLVALDLLARRRDRARAMLVALAVALAVAAPFFIRNAALFGSAFYPPIRTNPQIALDALNTRLFSLPPGAFYRNACVVMGPIVPWLALLALGWRVVRGRFDLVTGLIAGSLAFVLAAPWVARFQPRHLNPITAMLAVLGSIVLVEALARRGRVLVAAQAGLLVWAVVFTLRITSLRSSLDADPADLAAYRAIAARVPANGVVLSRLTYDTWYYARRAATWPIPWGETAGQLELFTVSDPDRFAEVLDREGIAYLLVPRGATGERFSGANFPKSFIASVATLVQRGQLSVLWRSDRMVLVGRAR